MFGLFKACENPACSKTMPVGGQKYCEECFTRWLGSDADHCIALSDHDAIEILVKARARESAHEQHAYLGKHGVVLARKT